MFPSSLQKMIMMCHRTIFGFVILTTILLCEYSHPQSSNTFRTDSRKVDDGFSFTLVKKNKAGYTANKQSLAGWAGSVMLVGRGGNTSGLGL